MIVLVGASASGKTELAKQLYQTYGYSKCITTTTRLPRANEIDGKDYHFLSSQQFQILQNQNAFYEVTHYDHQAYGIQKKDVNQNGVVIVDPNGANTLVAHAAKDVFVVYVETKKEIREKRMLMRGDSLDNIYKRLENDEKVFNKSHFQRIDLLLHNEDHTMNELAKTVHECYQEYINHK